MCGIIGYIGNEEAQPILMDGLKRMEYRGYDSAGVAVIGKDGKETNVQSVKKAGKLSNLAQELEAQTITGSVGIGHTRWATHGAPTDENAHPHTGQNGEIYLIHNGIIENYATIKQQLQEQGHTFSTETDTEVLAHLIESKYVEDVTLEQAVQEALSGVVGAYGIAVVSTREPKKLVAARLGSPLVLGIIGPGEFIVASDVTALLPYTREVVYLEEHDIATITPEGYKIRNIDDAPVERKANTVDWDIAQAEKQGYEHFLLKEIMEQADVVADALRGRIVEEDGIAHLRGFMEKEKEWRTVDRIYIVACGAAALAGRIGEYMIEEYAGIPVEVELGSEFRYRKPVITDTTAVIVVSQSGETADTIASLKEAKRHGALTFGIVNAVGSTIAREVDSGTYVHAGPEISVASTKAFIGMITVFGLLTLALGRQRGMSLVTGKRIAAELNALPEKIQSILERADDIQALARKYADYDHAFYLGRKYNTAIAAEGALKLKEIAYVHAEAYPSGELKHGPLALIDDRFFNLVIAPQDSVYEKNLSNIQEVKARGGLVIAVVTEGEEELAKEADAVMEIPKTLEMLTPILSVIPLQLFAYAIAVERGCDVDQPRNLAKSVTVE